MICPLGFGAYTSLDIQRRSRERAHLRVGLGDSAVRLCVGQPYGSAPLELTATRATVLLLLFAFLAACTVQLAGGDPAGPAAAVGICRPARRDAAQRGLLVGIRLPLAWPPTATLLPILAAAWLVYQKASRNPSGPQRPSQPRTAPT